MYTLRISILIRIPTTDFLLPLPDPTPFPMSPSNPQKSPSQQPINYSHNAQYREIQSRVRIQLIQIQDLLPVLNRALAVRQALVISASEDDAREGVRGEIPDGVAERREIVDAFEEGGHVDGHHACHELGDGEEDGD